MCVCVCVCVVGYLGLGGLKLQPAFVGSEPGRRRRDAASRERAACVGDAGKGAGT